MLELVAHASVRNCFQGGVALANPNGIACSDSARARLLAAAGQQEMAGKVFTTLRRCTNLREQIASGQVAR